MVHVKWKKLLDLNDLTEAKAFSQEQSVSGSSMGLLNSMRQSNLIIPKSMSRRKQSVCDFD